MAGEVKAAGRGCLMSIFTLLVIGSFLAIVGGIVMGCIGGLLLFCDIPPAIKDAKEMCAWDTGPCEVSHLFSVSWDAISNSLRYALPWLAWALLLTLGGLAVFIPSFISLSILQGQTKALIARLNTESKLSFDDHISWVATPPHLWCSTNRIANSPSAR